MNVSPIFTSDEELRATGTVIVLEGESAAYPLKLESLDTYTTHKVARPKSILLSVREATRDHPRAPVRVDDGYRQRFLQIFQDYLEKSGTGETPRIATSSPTSRVSATLSFPTCGHPMMILPGMGGIGGSSGSTQAAHISTRFTASLRPTNREFWNVRSSSVIE